MQISAVCVSHKNNILRVKKLVLGITKTQKVSIFSQTWFSKVQNARSCKTGVERVSHTYNTKQARTNLVYRPLKMFSRQLYFS